MKAFHDKMISRREFKVGQKVLLYYSRLHLFPVSCVLIGLDLLLLLMFFLMVQLKFKI